MCQEKRNKQENVSLVVLSKIFLIMLLIPLCSTGISLADVHVIYEPGLPLDSIPFGHVYGQVYDLVATPLDSYENWGYIGDSPVNDYLVYDSLSIGSEAGLWDVTASAEGASGIISHAGGSVAVDFYVDNGDSVTLNWIFEGFEGYDYSGWSVFLGQITPDDYIPLGEWRSDNPPQLPIEFNLDPSGRYRLEWALDATAIDNPGEHGLETLTVSISDSGSIENIPDIDVLPESYDFGEVATGSYQSTIVTISNTGDADLNLNDIGFLAGSSGSFSITATSPSPLPNIIAPGESVYLEITFAPETAGYEQAILQIYSDDPDEELTEVYLEGTGVFYAPNIVVTPDYYNFGEVETGYGLQKVIRIDNTGNDVLTINDLEFTAESSDSFSISSSPSFPIIIQPEQYIEIEITFAPLAGGHFIAVLQISNDDPEQSIAEVIFDGEGVLPEMLPEIVVTPDEYDFGEVSLGASQSTIISISNEGQADLNIESIAFTQESSNSFYIGSASPDPLPSVLAPGESVEIEIAFSPLSKDNSLAVLEIMSSDPTNPIIQVNLSGTGVSILDITTKSITSKTKWISCNITAPEGFDVSEINLSTIKLNGVPAERISANRRKQVVAARFSGADLALSPGLDPVLFTVTGNMNNGSAFSGCEYVYFDSRGKTR